MLFYSALLSFIFFCVARVTGVHACVKGWPQDDPSCTEAFIPVFTLQQNAVSHK